MQHNFNSSFRLGIVAHPLNTRIHSGNSNVLGAGIINATLVTENRKPKESDNKGVVSLGSDLANVNPFG